MTLAILIPAAGASSRMQGRDKLLETIDDVPQLRRIVDFARPLAPVFVTLPAADHPRADVLPDDVQIVIVPDWQSGMSASLRAGVCAIPQGHDILIQPADMPDIGPGDLATLMTARGASPDALIWQATTEDGTPGHPVLFHHSLRDAFAGLTGDAGARAIIAAHQDARQLVPLPGTRARVDLDTPEDWADWRLRR